MSDGSSYEDKKKARPENSVKKDNTKKKRRINPFDNSLFSMVFALFSAVVLWFYLASGTDSTAEKPFYIEDVSIEVDKSDAAIADGLEIFSMTQEYADLAISATSTIKNRLTKEDVRVIGTFAPSSTKTSGTGLNTAVVKLQAVKTNALGDYTILEVSPEEITVEYDRYKEKTLPLEKNIKVSVNTGFLALEAISPTSTISISGPESSVNKIRSAALVADVTENISSDYDISVPVTLYGQDGRVMSDIRNMYLTTSAETVDVTIPVLAQKTVEIIPVIENQPKGFAANRITVEPSTLDIAATSEILKDIESIHLTDPINFTEVDTENNVFELEIPLPKDVRDLNNVETATVTINLNGFVVKPITTRNVTVTNSPANNLVQNAQNITVKVMGSESQVAKLTGDSISVVVDMAGEAIESGSIIKPAEVKINDSTADTCWVTGKYEVALTFSAAPANDDGSTAEATLLS